MPITFLSYLQSFFSKRDSTLQRSLLLVIFSHFTLFVFIACFTYQTSFKDLKNKAHKTAEEIEKIIFDEFDSVLIECFVFLKEIQKNALNKRRIDLSRKLKFFPSNSPSSCSNAYLGHTINISPPFVDEETGLWTISLKIPVHDHNNISIGFFIKNLNLREFSEKIRGRLHREGVIFSLIDNYYRVIFQSKNNPYDIKSIFYIELFEEIRQRQSPLDDNFSFVKDTQFLYFKGLKSYPYMILTGINYSEFYMEVKQSIILQFIYILISLFSFILILLFFSYKKQRSFSCFQAVIKNYYFQFSVGSILDHIKGFSHPNESLLRIKNDKYPPSFPMESGLFIRDCLLLLEDNIDKYQVKIEINIKKNSLIEENHFSLQQILVGLLSFSIEHNKGKNISISSDSDEANLYIKIEDRTFFLSEGMRDQFSEKLREDNLFLLNFKNIKDTANTLGIKISIQEKSPKGNIILITIPHSSETGLNINQHNIISFEKIKTQKS